MKKVISVTLLSMFGFAVFAQDSTSKTTTMGKDSMQRMADSGATSHSQTNLKRDSAASTNNTANSATGNSTDTSKGMSKSQQQTTTTTTTDTATKVIATDRVIMKDDKMYIVKNGDSSILDKSYKLESGAIVSTTGNVKFPSGKTVQLKNGQFIELKKPSSSDAKKITDTKKTSITSKKKMTT